MFQKKKEVYLCIRNFVISKASRDRPFVHFEDTPQSPNLNLVPFSSWTSYFSIISSLTPFSSCPFISPKKSYLKPLFFIFCIGLCFTFTLYFILTVILRYQHCHSYFLEARFCIDAPVNYRKIILHSLTHLFPICLLTYT